MVWFVLENVNSTSNLGGWTSSSDFVMRVQTPRSTWSLRIKSVAQNYPQAVHDEQPAMSSIALESQGVVLTFYARGLVSIEICYCVCFRSRSYEYEQRRKLADCGIDHLYEVPVVLKSHEITEKTVGFPHEPGFSGEAAASWRSR